MKIIFDFESERDEFLSRCEDRSCVDCILYKECENQLFMLTKYYNISKIQTQIPTILIKKGDDKPDDNHSMCE